MLRFLVVMPVWLVGVHLFAAAMLVLSPIQLVCWVFGDNAFRYTVPCAPIIDAAIRADAWLDEFVTGERARKPPPRAHAANKLSLPRAEVIRRD